MLRPFAFPDRPRAVAIAAAVLIGGGICAHAARNAIGAAPPPAPATAIGPVGFDRQDHFAGAAMLYLVEDQPALMRGTTGTAVLPDLPLPAGADALAGDGTVVAAKPFSLANAAPLAKARAVQCLATAIYYEAGSQSEAGQRAVAQVILNRVRHPAFPNSVCGVVYQGSAQAGCQFSFACDGSLARLPGRAGMARATRYAAQALTGYVQPQVGTATHYHTYAVTPAWSRALVMTAAIGAHFFHRWKGYWGTTAAFRQRYAGIEPVPEPQPRPTPPIVALKDIAPLPAARVPAPLARTAYADSGLATPPAPVAGKSNLPESKMLDKWAQTGEPLR